ncbi:MAG: hypothetical protein HRT88_11570 [Lentisphaeraceae bacterium]|nr:hypothetical protein [Lentisphaeraceae bacterium]
MRTLFTALLFYISSFTQAQSPHTPSTQSESFQTDNHAGLRWAHKLSPTKIRLYFGYGFLTEAFKKENNSSFQVASENDEHFHKRVNARSFKIIKNEEEGQYAKG